MNQHDASPAEAKEFLNGDAAKVAGIQDWAARGELASSPTARQDVYSLAWPIVFSRLTRPIELRQGHVRCAQGMHHLEPDCLDRFHDDVEAVVEDTLRNTGDRPIQNLAGWMVSRLNAVTVDAHRRRRGERGALQRPRLPAWLAAALKDDPWLVDLAMQILVWVGLPTGTGTGVWPLGAWAQRRADLTGDRARTSLTTVLADVETVLSAMRHRPIWYERYVERPLGRKETPVAPDPDTHTPLMLDEEVGLPLVPSDAALDTKLLELASLALESIEARVRGGVPLSTAVEDVVRAVFGRDDLDDGFDDDQIQARVTNVIAHPELVQHVIEVVDALLRNSSLATERTPALPQS